MSNENTLIIIPARKGSKGIPKKNMKIFNGKPLISHTVDFALMNKDQGDIICVSTNDEDVIELFNKNKKIELLKRPEELSKDNSGMSEVISHAIDFYERKKIFFQYLLLLQPTSPLRSSEDYNNLMNSSDKNFDMIVSVCESNENPYFNLYEDNKLGFLSRSKPSKYASLSSNSVFTLVEI